MTSTSAQSTNVAFPSTEGKMVTEGKMNTSLVMEDSPEVLHQRLGQLNQLRKSRHFCDVILQVGSSEIHAHRSVLACASPYFFELFTSDDDRKTAHEGRLMYKLSSGFERDSVERLVNYVYTGCMEVPDQLVKTVFIAARKLKMETVSRACGEHLVAHLTPESCLSVRAINGIASNAALVNRVDEYIQQVSDLVQVTRDALGIPKIQVSVIHRTHDEAAITGRALCNLVLEWVKKQMVEEDLHLDLMKEKKHMLYLNIDNSLHDCSDIQSGDLNDSDMVQDYKKMSRKLSQTNIKMRRKSTTPQPVKPRLMLYSRSISDKDDSEQDSDWKLIAYAQVSESSWVAVVTLKGSVTVMSVQQKMGSSSPTHTPISSRPASVEKVDYYTVIPHMSSPKCATGTGNLNGHLLVCGGYDRGECLRTVEDYNPEMNAWTIQPPMHQGRGRFDLTVLNGKAYAIGGCDGSKELSTVEVLEENAKKWSSVAPLPLARSNTGVCSLDGKVFCIGGWNGQYGIKQCDMYTPETDIWQTIASLHIGRYQAGVAAYKGMVYAIGGCDSWNCLNSVEVYDSRLDTWRFAAPMTTPRRGCGAEVFKGKLYVMGGSDGTHSLCTTEIYDLETNTWMPGPSMTTCRANVGVAVVNGKLYAVGGFSGKNFLNSIEYLDPATDEWTNFTPKPEVIRNGIDNYTKRSGYRNEENSQAVESDGTQGSDHEDAVEHEAVANGHHVAENGCNGLPNGVHSIATNGH
ncbi:influenza virus NS1A-binding protein homolog isoform X2 [Cherax quadricarinatus]|uniref:influenza virus NS1A-binding protein homolog isoform X2 n=1 Tax=Cherax quadricarinatus TaxID=27406 RepID=UPI002378B6B5|nr:influenza virus NS1A-binding protein homolog isoform X2 [Cherax quadricarinatus]